MSCDLDVTNDGARGWEKNSSHIPITFTKQRVHMVDSKIVNTVRATR